jgi:hypothetical protein
LLLDRGELLSLFLGEAYLLLVVACVVLRRGRVVLFPCGRVLQSQRLRSQLLVLVVLLVQAWFLGEAYLQLSLELVV